MNRSLTERARCLRLNAGLPKSFWADAVSMTCHLINRSPCASLGGKVAKDLWTSNPVDFDHLHIFYCSTYVHVPNDERSKLDLKSKHCIFLGYKKGVKGYKFWDPVTRKMVISRDAVFVVQSMLQQHQDKMPKIGSSSNALQMELEPHPVAIENRGSSHSNIQSNIWLGYEDMVSFALLISGEGPTTFHGAITSQEKKEWMGAMVEEIEYLQKNHTWELVQLPEGKKAIGCKWMHKKETNSIRKRREKVQGLVGSKGILTIEGDRL
ncbi:UNVERIFIED_CONTAM: Retrovirus-related Pol polyprotein from transposon TNT 1-94 [Sesamum radiatum]|uniref:Retrovirus-related Pol polyprotein from transposon TNT 1-94 n=1 Tax=Sesamum radiatum TaxID=300843 RepID=A0AAW2L7Q1_SESRA